MAIIRWVVSAWRIILMISASLTVMGMIVGGVRGWVDGSKISMDDVSAQIPANMREGLQKMSTEISTGLSSQLRSAGKDPSRYPVEQYADCFVNYLYFGAQPDGTIVPFKVPSDPEQQKVAYRERAKVGRELCIEKFPVE